MANQNNENKIQIKENLIHFTNKQIKFNKHFNEQ